MNTFVALPVPTSNSSGAAVDVSGMGKTKTLIAGGEFNASVTIEYATDLLGTDFAPIETFRMAGQQAVEIACRWMRATVTGYKSGAPTMDVGAAALPASFAEIPAPPPGGGAGLSVAVGAMPAFKTVVVGGDFSGALNIEISDDGTHYAQVATFKNGGGKSFLVYGAFARASLTGGGSVSVFIGGAEDAISSGGSPPFPVPPVVREIFVRTGGSDDTGNGTLANPYETLPRAAQDPWLISPPGYFWKINNTGVTDALPVDYTLPAWKGGVGFLDFSKRFWRFQGLVTIEADPEIVPLTPASDATIQIGDLVGPPTLDPITGLITITLAVARATWTNANLKGKHLIGAAVGIEQSVIHEVTTTTIQISTDIVPTFPADIMQESSHLSGTQDQLAALSVLNCDHIVLHGQEISEVGGLTSIFSEGLGNLSFELCTLQNPYLQSIAGFEAGKILDCRVYGDFIIIGQNSLGCNRSFFDNCTGVSFVDAANLLANYRNCVFEACDPFEPRTFVPFLGEFPKPVTHLAVSNCLFRDALSDAVIVHGAAGFLQNVDIQNSEGNGLVVNEGVGLLKLENVGSSLPNGAGGTGFGLLVNDGQFVKADAATYGSLTPLTGVDGDMKVGDGATRTWSDYSTGADDRPPLLELDLTSFADTGGTFSDSAAAAAYIIGTGSKVFS